jgi:hypothetical protein
MYAFNAIYTRIISCAAQIRGGAEAPAEAYCTAAVGLIVETEEQLSSVKNKLENQVLREASPTEIWLLAPSCSPAVETNLCVCALLAPARLALLFRT